MAAPTLLDNKTLPDEELMGLYQRGEASAFDELLRRHQDRVFRYFVRLLVNRQAAEEATQEVFFHIIRSARRYEPRARFTTWMFRIVHNYGIDCLRRQKLRMTQSLDAPVDASEADNRTLLDLVADPDSDLERLTSEQQIHQRVEKALARLNPDQREVFLMRENLGLAFHEIADTLSVSTNTVKSRMRYALSSLKKTLKRDLKPTQTQKKMA